MYLKQSAVFIDFGEFHSVFSASGHFFAVVVDLPFVDLSDDVCHLPLQFVQDLASFHEGQPGLFSFVGFLFLQISHILSDGFDWQAGKGLKQCFDSDSFEKILKTPQMIHIFGSFDAADFDTSKKLVGYISFGELLENIEHIFEMILSVLTLPFIFL